MAHQTNLADLKRMLGINLFLDLDDHALMNTRQQGLVCSFMGLRLSSVFQPVVTANGKIAGREALLRANAIQQGLLTPQAAFDLASDARKLVSFDRLVRTIHLLNHANVFNEHELIFLNVHPRLLTSVSDHGRTFEQILHYYSVPTARVVIEIQESAVQDGARLEEAVNNYRSLGYRIAVDNFGGAHSDLERVLKLAPDIVKLDGILIQAAEDAGNATGLLNQLVNRLHGARVQVVVEGIETAGQLEIARNSGADLLQGYHLGCPEFAAATREQLYRGEPLAA